MASNTTRSKTSAAKAAAIKDTDQKITEVESTKKEPEAFVVKDIDPNQYVIVRNGFQGKLIYISPRTGERFVWDEFGDEMEMELRELRTAKNRYKKFFEQNWFMFDEDWIVNYLGVERYYKNALPIDKFDDVFDKSPAEAKKIISKLSNGQKKSLTYRAMDLIADKKIDSIKMIEALEESLGVDLIEK